MCSVLVRIRESTSYFYIRSFEDGKVNRYELRNGDSVKVQVQHGDVIFMNWREQFALFISEEFYCTGLSERSALNASSHFAMQQGIPRFDFIAIVQNDGHGEPKGSEVKVEEMGGEVKGEEQVENVGEEKLQES